MLYTAMQELTSIHNGLLKMKDERANALVPVIADMLWDVQVEILRCSMPTSDPGLMLSH